MISAQSAQTPMEKRYHHILISARLGPIRYLIVSLISNPYTAVVHHKEMKNAALLRTCRIRFEVAAAGGIG
jgi:hypothetical protein